MWAHRTVTLWCNQCRAIMTVHQCFSTTESTGSIWALSPSNISRYDIFNMCNRHQHIWIWRGELFLKDSFTAVGLEGSTLIGTVFIVRYNNLGYVSRTVRVTSDNKHSKDQLLLPVGCIPHNKLREKYISSTWQPGDLERIGWCRE